jgi:hypothetical protein
VNHRYLKIPRKRLALPQRFSGALVQMEKGFSQTILPAEYLMSIPCLESSED